MVGKLESILIYFFPFISRFETIWGGEERVELKQGFKQNRSENNLFKL